MPTLASSNRAQITIKEEGVYPTNFGVPQGGNGKNINVTGETLDYTIGTEKSKVLRSDRSTTDLVQVSASAQGGINLEHIYRDMDPLLEALMQDSWQEYGTAGVSATMDLTFTSTVLTADTAPTSASAFSNLDPGQWFVIIPDAGASATVKEYLAGRAFRVSASVATTSDTITVDAATPFNTTVLTAGLTGAKIATSSIANGVTMKSYTIEVAHADIDRYRVYKGMIPSKLSWSMKSGSILTGSMDFLGKNMSLEEASVMGTAAAASSYESANAVRGIFDILENGSSVGVTTYIKSADIMFDNSLRIQDAIGVFGAAGIASGTINASLKLEVYFADSVMYNKFINNTVSSVTIPVLDPSGNGYIYYFPRIKYSAAKVNATGMDQDSMLSMEATALLDNNPASPTNGATMVIYRVGR